MSSKHSTPDKGHQKMTPVKRRTKVKSTQEKAELDLGLSPATSCSDQKLRSLLVPTMFASTMPPVEERRLEARSFMSWFSRAMDEERSSLPLYLGEDVALEWFGRSVKSRKKVRSFIASEIHPTRHCWTSVDVCAPFTVRAQKNICAPSWNEEELAYPIGSLQDPPATILKRSLSRLSVNGPSCKRPATPPSPLNTSSGLSGKKRFKMNFDSSDYESPLRSANAVVTRSSAKKIAWRCEGDAESHGDGEKGRLEHLTPPKKHRGEGDCQLATKQSTHVSQNDAVRYYAEANGCIEFSRMRIRRGDVKWERKCRLRVCYTRDRAKPSDYVVQTIAYSDNNKCRRNLLAAFEQVDREAQQKKDNTTSPFAPN